MQAWVFNISLPCILIRRDCIPKPMYSVRHFSQRLQEATRKENDIWLKIYRGYYEARNGRNWSIGVSAKLPIEMYIQMSVTPRGIPSERLCDSFIRVVFNNETSNCINARIELRMIFLYKPPRDHCMYANRICICEVNIVYTINIYVNNCNKCSV